MEILKLEQGNNRNAQTCTNNIRELSYFDDLRAEDTNSFPFITL